MPFYEADVRLLVKLELRQKKDGKYYIRSQEDFYQVNDLIKFFIPFGGSLFLWILQLFATFGCALGALLLAPFTGYLEHTMVPQTEKARRP